jgi:hypothetical protein
MACDLLLIDLQLGGDLHDDETNGASDEERAGTGRREDGKI